MRLKQVKVLLTKLMGEFLSAHDDPTQQSGCRSGEWNQPLIASGTAAKRSPHDEIEPAKVT
jgi:hypothetical protein